ncbi:hypothetical protein [Sinomonas atrocyanea]|jgi:hypothetical protein|uniref:hypothetical protein n=1 Tax=Sinomonas atrocyanea TaxID=37927 RepID=UPI00277D2483|nr:hypothetical protein [Sinomonas atrocyanea]MDQ0259554.1 putative coiled-coil protein SlyX [Sinomonas atrocyanea]MDR6623187.1 putative coiled-coil protein SlyX [Sinomonas atrocyanea]
MNGPSEELRTEVERRIDSLERELAEADQRLPDISAWVGEIEEDVVRLVTRVLEECRRDVESDGRLTPDRTALDRDGALGVYAAVQAWAALASYVVARVYAPRSPWHHGLATAATKVVAVLGSIAIVLAGPLRPTAAALGAQSSTIGTQFPSAPLTVSLTFAG